MVEMGRATYRRQSGRNNTDSDSDLDLDVQVPTPYPPMPLRGGAPFNSELSSNPLRLN